MSGQPQERLAIEGGQPVRGKDNPLPGVFPRRIGKSAGKYYEQLIASGNTKAPPFEDALAKAFGVKYALAAANCTVACHTALAAAGVGPGDEVVVSPISDYGTLYGILAQRAIPVFADADPLSGNVTAETIKEVLTERTKGIFVVHWAGITCDMGPIVELARSRAIPLLEDVCQAPLAEYDGQKVGAIGDLGTLSFDNEKHLSCGSGGAVLTGSKEFYDRAANFAGARGSYVDDPLFGRKHKVMGCNYRFDVVRTPMAMAQLEELPELVARRRELGRLLSAKLSAIEGIKPSPVPARGDAVYWIYPFVVETDRFSAGLDDMAKAMDAEGLKGVGSGRYYLLAEGCPLLNDLRHTYGPGALPGGATDGYLGRRYTAASVPQAKWYVEHMLRWSFTEKYGERDIEDIVRIIRKVADRYRVRIA